VTNAHVLSGAEKIEVFVPPQAGTDPSRECAGEKDSDAVLLPRPTSPARNTIPLQIPLPPCFLTKGLS
jgi:hypothetical protein